MTATFFLAGQEMLETDIRENGDGTVSIGLNAGFWVTVTSRQDCSALMQAAVDADSVFIRQQAAAEAREVVAAELAPADDVQPGPLAEYQALSNELHYAELDADQNDARQVQMMPVDESEDTWGEPEAGDLPPLPQRIPAGPPDVPGWQAAINAGLSPEALAGSQPLASLAPDPEPEPQEEEVKG